MARKRKKKKVRQENAKKRSSTNKGKQSNLSAQLLESGLTCHRRGDLSGAKAFYKKVLTEAPHNADAYHYLGVVSNQNEQYGQAIPLIEKSLSIKPGNATAHFNLGVAYYAVGNVEGAREQYETAVRISPALLDAHNNLGLIWRLRGRTDLAAEHFAKALEINPGFIQARVNLGNALVASGNIEQGISHLEQAMTRLPTDAGIYNNLGVALNEAGRLEDAEAQFRKAVSINPGFSEAYNNLGNLLGKQGDSESAIACFKRAIEIRSGYPDALTNLGIEFKKMGRLDQALTCFRGALSTDTNHVNALAHLASVKKHTEYDADIRVTEKLFNSRGINDNERMLLGFALGKIFEELKDFDRSFGYLTQANKLKRRMLTYNQGEDLERVKILTTSFTKKSIRQNRLKGYSDPTPIFIVGMPRSGSTLVEQILSSHDQVHGGGELKWFSEVVRNIKWERKEGKGTLFTPIKGWDDFGAAGRVYISHIRRLSKKAPRITDKMPHNFLNIGLIKSCLPEAKIIHCLREPMDTCFSIFKHHFTERDSHKYAYDLKELGKYYKLYQNLMDHWKRVVPGEIYDVSYERLVNDLRGETENLLTFLGLPWEDQCLEFYTQKRSVATASAVQVRQPIYTDSVALWRNFETDLGPLKAELGYTYRLSDS